MLNWAVRYAPVLSIVDRLAPVTICDVGSGARGLAEYVPSAMVIAADIAFEGDRPPNHVAVVASADALPFRTSAFDLSVSMDMLEHLPAALRAPAVAEVMRVARRAAVVGFPSGRPAEAADRLKRRVLRRWGFDEPEWLGEHLRERYPRHVDVLQAAPTGWRSRARRNDSVLVDLFVFAAEYRLPARLVARLERFVIRHRLPRLLAMPPAYRRIISAEAP